MKVTEQQIREALEMSGGFLSEAAKMLNISSPGLSKRIKHNTSLQESRESIKERYLDLAESKLIGLVKDGNLGAICFYLKCQGRHRGWVEKQEIEHFGDSPVEITITAAVAPKKAQDGEGYL
jgi:hypothetical protein